MHRTLKGMVVASEMLKAQPYQQPVGHPPPRREHLQLCPRTPKTTFWTRSSQQACDLRAVNDRLARDNASLRNELSALRDALSDPLVPISRGTGAGAGAHCGSPLLAGQEAAGAALAAASSPAPGAGGVFGAGGAAAVLALQERLAAAEGAAEAAVQKAASEERAAVRSAREWQLERQQMQVGVLRWPGVSLLVFRQWGRAAFAVACHTNIMTQDFKPQVAIQRNLAASPSIVHR